MTRIYVIVEGQTEEAFVKELLAPAFLGLGKYLTPIIIGTSPGYKGGLVRYGKVKPQLERLCKQDPAGYVSTFFDLYAVPDDFPGKLTAHFPSAASGHQKASFLERQLAQDIARRNFIPYFSVHEFEALLFTLPEKFGEWTDNANVVTALQAMADAQNTPEDINDHPQTAPSKRILSVMPGYQKTFHGPLIACEIGLEAMRQACPHFAEWLGVLEALP